MEVKEIKLKTEGKLEYWIKPITKEINDELKEDIYQIKITKDINSFKEKYKFDFSAICAHGDTTVNEKYISQYIPHCNWYPFGDIQNLQKSSICYAIKDHDFKQSRLHHDCLSSWNCILQCLNNPKYVLIYKRYETI